MDDNLEKDFITIASELRKEILNIEEYVKLFKHNVATGYTTIIETGEMHSDKSEILANITLAYRHLEDARMRIGKSIQAYDGGTSVYNR